MKIFLTPGRAAAVLVMLMGGAGDVSAQSPDTKKPQSTYDKIWKFAEWYEDETNPAVQKVLFTGRFQFDFAALDADEGEHSEWNVRRFRFGPRIVFLKHFTFSSEVEVNPQEEPFYQRFTDLYVQWSRKEAVVLTVGKQGMVFTVDGSTSSKELLAIDRSNLSNNLWFPQEYLPGVAVSGKVAPWVYRGGVYSAGAMNREFGDFSGSFTTLGTIGYDFAEDLEVKEALLSANYVYQNPDPNNTFTRELEHVVSVNFRYDTGTWGARGDLSAANGSASQSNLWGVMMMPFVNLTPKLQLVGRYTFLDSSDANGIRLATYESTIVSGRGDTYNELYAGANYYFYGHKLKVQSGVQFADMNDSANDGGTYSGVSWVTGLRVGW